MLSEWRAGGAREALSRYGVKSAAPSWLRTVGDVAAKGGRFLFGHPDKLLLEGGKAFGPGGAFDAKNVFWPTVPGKPVQQWMGRAFGTILPAYGVLRAAKGIDGDPNEGRLSNALGALGGALGGAYGYSMGGIVGAPFIQRAGANVGKNLGRMLGSRPPPSAEPTPEQVRMILERFHDGGYYR